MKIGNIRGVQGPQGPQGPQGEAGQNGLDGKSFLSGNGVPNDFFGKDGDTYLDLNSMDVYKRVDGSWGTSYVAQNMTATTIGQLFNSGSVKSFGFGLDSEIIHYVPNSLTVEGKTVIEVGTNGITAEQEADLNANPNKVYFSRVDAKLYVANSITDVSNYAIAWVQMPSLYA